MFDHLNTRYLKHKQQGRSKPLNQDFDDGNPACKHAFLDF